MPQQLPQISILSPWHPDPRKTTFEQRSQNQLRILAIRLLFAYSCADFSRIVDPKLKPQLAEQSFKQPDAILSWCNRCYR